MDAPSFPDELLYLKTWFQSLTKQQRAANIVGLSILDSNLSLKKDSTGWSSSETTPTSDHGFLSADKGRGKPLKRYQSNTQRRNALLALSKTLEFTDPASKGRDSARTVPRDISNWLRSIRLHKYDHCLSHLSWAELTTLTEEDLVSLGVATQGARDRFRKFLGQCGKG
ncbi:Sam domain family protein [Favolaschia claudopus]|uniref:Sam domain family protein n=1 Tax=Favolaschia claudopus TaxID=2862362 RepID=A0AAW0BPU4_9AGAR